MGIRSKSNKDRVIFFTFNSIKNFISKILDFHQNFCYNKFRKILSVVILLLNTISKISLPDNTQYDLTTVNRDFPLIVGTQTAVTGNWKGIAPTDDF